MSTKMGRRGARSRGILASAILLLAMPSYADDTEVEAEAENPAEQALLPLSDEESAALGLLLESIDSDKATIDFLTKRAESNEGLIQSVSEARRDKIVARRFASILEMARTLVKLDNEGKDTHRYKRPVEQDL